MFASQLPNTYRPPKILCISGTQGADILDVITDTHIWSTTNKGVNWSSYKLPLMTNKNLVCVTKKSSGVRYAVDEQSLFQSYSDGVWNQYSAIWPLYVASDANRIFTSDGNQVWLQKSGPTSARYPVTFLSSGTDSLGIVYSLDNYGSTIYAFTSNGLFKRSAGLSENSRWTTEYSDYYYNTLMSAVGLDILFLGAYGMLNYYYLDTITESHPYPANTINSLFASSTSSVYISDSNNVWNTADKGLNWTSIPLPF